MTQVVGHRTQCAARCRNKQKNLVDWPAVRQCRDDQVWRRIFANIEPPSWSDDPHAHWQLARKQLLEALAAEFPVHNRRPKRRYVSEQAWQLRRTRNHVKRELIWRFPCRPDNAVEDAFTAWKCSCGLPQTYLQNFVKLLRLLGDRLRTRQTPRILSKQLRSQLRADRITFLDCIAEEADGCPAQSLYTTLRRSGFEAQSFHRNTWFHTRNSASLTRTLCGTRPGDGCADLLFNMVVLDILDIITSTAKDAGLVYEIGWNNLRGPQAASSSEASIDFLAATWADMNFVFVWLWPDRPFRPIENRSISNPNLRSRSVCRCFAAVFSVLPSLVLAHGRPSTPKNGLPSPVALSGYSSAFLWQMSPLRPCLLGPQHEYAHTWVVLCLQAC